ncbi:GNAT family N-acetyltransferase [Motilibacter deserti]|uniref:GNAT family N-acetyltransferase n=1 Tax=Motilibacter deserti TaxID=2714956 RepID=A0ABX0GN21_9ACTN|nr:GNAT family N-acetyltransferase [Motilibacter deserti]
MPRPSVSVRAAVPADVPALVEMWSELRELSRDRAAPVPSERGVRARLERADQDPDLRIVVATLDGEVAGMAVLTHQPYAALFDVQSVHLHFMHVRDGFRRKGVGHALVAAAAAYAEEMGADHVMTSTLPTARDANRFYARLGFAPMVVRRAAPVATVRRRLAADAGVPEAVEGVVARRRSLRSRSRLRVARLAE